MKTKMVLGMFLAASALNAAVVEQVIVRQQWPWSTDIKVEYRIAGVTSPVDIAVEVYNGEQKLESPQLAASMSGDLFGISGDCAGSFTIDPVKAFGEEMNAIGNFRVKLSLVESAANVNEVIYKILNLDEDPVTVTDVTRADILGRKYGTYETEYGDNIRRGFSSPLEDVLIWTGVTNGNLYRTSKLALRKIPAAGKSYMMGTGAADSAKVQVSFTNDFWMGVFPMTQAHVKRFKTSYVGYSTNELYSATRAADYLTWEQARGNWTKWPKGIHADASDSSVIGLIQAATGNYRFDLPTSAQWEFAARGGNSSIHYGGPGTSANGVLGSHRSTTNTDRNCDWTSNSYPPGRYAPNAYGLYDTFYNVTEWCLDQACKDADGKVAGRDGGVEPRGVDRNDGYKSMHSSGQAAHIFRGGGYAYPFSEIGSLGCTVDWWDTAYLGFRLCLHGED